jgi:hypothetical protein
VKRRAIAAAAGALSSTAVSGSTARGAVAQLGDGVAAGAPTPGNANASDR